jgi:hypothetical protein
MVKPSEFSVKYRAKKHDSVIRILVHTTGFDKQMLDSLWRLRFQPIDYLALRQAWLKQLSIGHQNDVNYVGRQPVMLMSQNYRDEAIASYRHSGWRDWWAKQRAMDEIDKAFARQLEAAKTLYRQQTQSINDILADTRSYR